MIDIVVPDIPATRRIQEEQGRYYWSRCAELLFRREGVVGVRRGFGPAEAGALAVYCRDLDSTAIDQRRPAVLEGPLDSELARSLGLAAETVDLEEVALGDPISLELFPPRMRMRGVDKRPVPLDLTGSRARWQVGPSEVQFLSGRGWDPVIVVSDPATNAAGAVAVRRDSLLVFGLPVFDVLLRWMAIPPLEERYGGFDRQMRHIRASARLVDLILDHAERVGGLVPELRVGRWPVPFDAGLTLRHDYDRSATRESLEELIAFYGLRQIKASVGFLPQLREQSTIDLFEAGGHEIQAHVAAPDRPTLRADLSSLRCVAGRQVSGVTMHGGPRGLGFRGQTHFEWLDDLGVEYCETFGLREGICSPVCRTYDGVPDVSAVIATPSHHSFDGSTRPDDHRLELLRVEVPKSLGRGDYVIIMNHPDVHTSELRELLKALPLERTWRATTAEVARWHHNLLYTSWVRPQDERMRLSFTRPLERDARILVDGAWQTVPSGTTSLIP